jgi:predicted nucleic acid-binding protein
VEAGTGSPARARGALGRPAGLDGYHPLLSRPPPMAAKIVVHGSVLVKWFKTREEELLDEAQKLLMAIEAQGVQVHVPALLLYEVGNLLLVKTRLGLAALDEIIERVEELPMVVAPPAAPLLRRAFRLGREFGLTFYDASFLALAVELGCPCVTADRQLFERAHRLPQLRHLARVGSIA